MKKLVSTLPIFTPSVLLHEKLIWDEIKRASEQIEEGENVTAFLTCFSITIVALAP